MHTLLSDTAQPFDALDARSNFEPIMQSVRDPQQARRRLSAFIRLTNGPAVCSKAATIMLK
jgi:hypothetical protein